MSGLLQDYVLQQAERGGDDVALVLGSQRMTYGELEQASNRMARHLIQAGCGPGDRVCLMMEKSPAAIVAMIATLKAGCAYVPLDVASPARRLERIVRSADPAAALVADRGAEICEELRSAGVLAPRVRIGALDPPAAERFGTTAAFGIDDLQSESAEPPARVGRRNDLAHILFTSGSTGVPKGVMITHANGLQFIEWAVTHFGIRRGDHVSGHPPLHFDLSTFDIYGSFRAGAELHLLPADLVLARQLAEFIAEHELIQWFSVPSAMTYMAKFGGLPDAGFPSLERVMWCGDVMPVPVLVQWMQRIPQARFTNLYGPTETTIASSYHTVPGVPRHPGGAIPIGRACADNELFVVGEQGGAATVGQVGEIHIGGPGVSPGYWRDAQSTMAAFVADPRPNATSSRVYRTGDLGRMDDNGVLHFVGRRDTQIKSRGYRIELGEIEAAISALGDVAECAVIGVASEDFSGTAICCAFAPCDEQEGDLVAIRASLREVLPAYMLPSRWQRLAVLPKNANGKIDRPALTSLFTAHDGSTAPG